MGDLAAALGLKKPPVAPDPAQLVNPVQNLVQPPAPMQTGQPVPPVGSDENPDHAGVMGDPWKPRKPTFLGALADGYLMANGLKPAFAINRDQRNVQEALRTYRPGDEEGQDLALSRLMKIRGHQDDAIGYMSKLEDDRRAERMLDKQYRALDMRDEDSMYQMAAGMMMQTDKDTWPSMRELVLKRAGARNPELAAKLDSIIPKEYDADAIKYIVAGAIKPKDQAVIQERRENNQARVGVAQGRLSEQRRHNQATETQAAVNEAGRNARDQANPKKYNDRRIIRTKNGLMELDKTGRFGRIGDQEWVRTSGAPGSKNATWERIR